MCTNSPGVTSIPPTDTATFTACTAIGPWPADTPFSRSWKPRRRIASTSRDGPSVTSPTHPTCCIWVVMISPASPALARSSGGQRCSMTSTVGFGHRVERVDHVEEREPVRLVGIGQPVHARDGVPDQWPELREDAPDRAVRVPALRPRLVQPEAQRVARVGRHGVGDGGRVDRAELGQQIVVWQTSCDVVMHPRCHPPSRILGQRIRLTVDR